ncbi:MAG: cystathionine gamma-synthase family protein [Bacteroidota bacterium]
MKKHKFHPESLMMSYGYHPEWSEGSIKCPIFQTSTFEFRTAEQGKAYFELAYGLRKPDISEKQGMIYSRINNPDLEILEDRLTIWDNAEACSVFESGMSAISTTFFEFLKPGDLLLYSKPLYGGTIHFIEQILPEWGVDILGFRAGMREEEMVELVRQSGKENQLAMMYVETPANPTNDLFDLTACSNVAKYFSKKEKQVVLAVDNTYMGPLWQHPLKFGADLVIYSATKYIGGHSDVIAGAVLGSSKHIGRLKVLRTFLGSMSSPFTSWLLLRSLETLKIRMEQQAQNAKEVAAFLNDHPLVNKVYYLGLLAPSDEINFAVYKKQFSSPGAMISFEIKGGEKEAFTFLNNLALIKLAVSLGSTESLAQHPATMTHAGMEATEKEKYGITPSLVRLSIGVENVSDLIYDIEKALKAVTSENNRKQFKKAA